MNSQARCSPGVLNRLGQLKMHSATYLSYLELFIRFMKLISYKTWNTLQCDRAQLCFWSIFVSEQFRMFFTENFLPDLESDPARPG